MEKKRSKHRERWTQTRAMAEKEKKAEIERLRKLGVFQQYNKGELLPYQVRTTRTLCCRSLCD